MDWLEVIRARYSTRRYNEQTIAGEMLERLLETAAQVERLAEPGVRIALVDGRERVGRILARLAGMYGLVQGAPHLLVGLLPEDSVPARLELGYVLEHVVLEATRLGIASCWMTGSYSPQQAADEIEIGAGEVVAATVALGVPRRDVLARAHDGAIRRLVAGHRRQPLEQIVFAERWGERWIPQEADPALMTLLEHARLAPSAHNGQPWRFIVGSQGLVLALTHEAPIDGGIVMAHVALVAAELGLTGHWDVRWGDPALGSALHLPPSAVAVGTFPLG